MNLLDHVALTEPVTTDDGTELPAGTTGAVVAMYRGGGVLVEIVDARGHTRDVITVERDKLKAVP